MTRMKGFYISRWGVDVDSVNNVEIATPCVVDYDPESDKMPSVSQIVEAEVTGLGDAPIQVVVNIPELNETWQDFFDADNEIEYQDGQPLEDSVHTNN